MRRLIRNFLNKKGYDIIKTGIPYIPQRRKPGHVKVGKYEILMPGNNIQLINYKLYPDLNIQLARLGKAIYRKYNNMTVVDVGANVGDTIAVLKSYVDVPVIAIEGDEISYQYLEKNAINFSDVSLIKTFLGDSVQEVNVSLEKGGWNTTIIPGKQSNTKVTFNTLDNILLSSGYEKAEIKLLKVDVEGYDTIVLRGALKTIHKYKPVLFFEYNRDNMKVINEEGLPTLFLFLEYGYSKIAFFDHKGSLIISTKLTNKAEITDMHNYISSSKNLVGYYDIAIFHEQDNEIAESFLEEEKRHL